MTDSPDSPPSAGVLRRLGAMFYDLLLVAAVMMVVTAVLMPLTGGEAIYKRFGAWEYAYDALLVVIVIVFFGVCWTRQGQTLGMMAWRLRIQRADGSLLSWGDVFKRLGAATVSLCLAGLGYWWIWIDRDRLAWPDRWTRTRVVVLPKKRD